MTDDTSHADVPEPSSLRKLRVLVTVLMWVMIVGMVSVVGLLVLRLSQPSPSAQALVPALPSEINLPDEARPLAVTAGAGWYAVVTEDDRILIFDASDGALLQDIPVLLPQQ